MSFGADIYLIYEKYLFLFYDFLFNLMEGEYGQSDSYYSVPLKFHPPAG